jgi:uracil-DNA glycosylase
MIIFSLLGSLCQTFPISPASTGMMAHSKKDPASPQLPLLSLSLKELAKQAKNCQNCDLSRNATQAVFGEGSPHAPIMLVGEQPGDQEDVQGKPFVGPARKIIASHIEGSRN